jgi:hypothetical protein
MTALAVAGVIASGGLGEIGSAVLTVLTVTALVLGSLVMAGGFAWALLLAAGWRHSRRHPIVTPPEAGDDLPAWLSRGSSRDD